LFKLFFENFKSNSDYYESINLKAQEKLDSKNNNKLDSKNNKINSDKKETSVKIIDKKSIKIIDKKSTKVVDKKSEEILENKFDKIIDNGKASKYPYSYCIVNVRSAIHKLFKKTAPELIAGEKSSKYYYALANAQARALREITGYQVNEAFMIGRGWICGRLRNNNAFNLPISINTTQNSIGSAILRQSQEWFQKLNQYGKNWQVYPEPSVRELYPNMKNKYDSPWSIAKEKIARAIKELTLLYHVTYIHRNMAVMKNICRYDHPNLTTESLAMQKGEISRHLDNILKSNRKINVSTFINLDSPKITNSPKIANSAKIANSPKIINTYPIIQLRAISVDGFGLGENLSEDEFDNQVIKNNAHISKFNNLKNKSRKRTRENKRATTNKKIKSSNKKIKSSNKKIKSSKISGNNSEIDESDDNELSSEDNDSFEESDMSISEDSESIISGDGEDSESMEDVEQTRQTNNLYATRVMPQKFSTDLRKMLTNNNLAKFFVDFENTSSINDDLEYFPYINDTTMIASIGCGCEDPETKKWTYKIFQVDYLTFSEEAKIINQWKAYMKNIKNLKIALSKKLNDYQDDKLNESNCNESNNNEKEFYAYCWSNAEPSLYSSSYNSAMKRHSEQHWKDDVEWADVYTLCRKEKLSIPGCFNLGLKSVAKSLYKLKCINTIWTPSPIDSGMRAAVALLKCGEEAQLLNRSMEYCTWMKELKPYLALDITTLYSIVNYFKKHHLRSSDKRHNF
jgi:hypothetical protein